jgi:NitT/TauT family transport system permease protein
MTPGWSILLRIVVPIGTLAIVLIAWQLGANATETFILPSPSQVIQALVDDWPILGPSLWVTLSLTLLALFAAVIGGVGLAVLMSQSRWIELALHPYAVVLQVTPIIAITPLVVIWVPETQPALLILAFLVAFFPVLSNTAQGLKSVDHNLLNLFDLYGASRWQMLWLLRTPSALPYFLTGLRIAGGLALIGAVVAEFAVGRGGEGSGLAYRIFNAQFDLDTPRAFAALLLLALAGVAIYAATSLISRFALRRWHESAAPREN